MTRKFLSSRIRQLLTCFFAFFLTQGASAGAYTDTFIVGKPCPSFHLRNIDGWNKGDATLDDFRGKWLVLDFWNKGCAACVASFHITNAMKAKYGEKMTFMLVALQDKEDVIHTLWHKYRDAQRLTMPCAFDSACFGQFGFHACPQVIVIDDKSIVRGWVNGISDSDVGDLLSGRRQYLVNPTPIPIVWQSPMLLKGNGGNDSDFVYRSIISKWNNTMAAFRPGTLEYAANQDVFQSSKMSLAELYNLAYFGLNIFLGGLDDPRYGHINLKPILELRDTSLFAADFYGERNLFAYSLTVRGGLTIPQIQESMQHDLANYFRYQAEVVTRDCPYLALLADDSARRKLPTKDKNGRKFHMEGTRFGDFTYTNATVNSFLFLISQSFPQDVVFVDETGINGNIDISMEQIFTDTNSVLAALHRNGLDLVWKKRPMRVVVIRDSRILPAIASLADTTAIPGL